jgi:AbrB family looped-hinge helix DNA binding protein
MKATGIVRRIDDLGRVVIPREIRQKLGIKDGEPFEIYTDTICGMPTVCFVKYQFDLSGTAKAFQDLVENYLDCDHPNKQEILVKLAEIDKMLSIER